jgi:anaerobic selenocysteine-containing dehydrogenase
MQKILTTCAMDCPDNCGMIASVEDGKIVRLQGNPEHGYTKGFLCRKGYRYPTRAYSPSRILFPQKKVKGTWKRIGWDEALDRVAEKIVFFRDEFGAPSFMHYQRSSSWGASKHLVKRCFLLLGDITVQAGSLCAGSVMAAQKADMGTRLGNDPEDLVNSKTILIWGKDPAKTSLHLIPILEEALKRGSSVILIDPLRTKTAAHADWHLSLRPGSDGYLAMGLARVLVKRGLVDEDFLKNHTAGYEKFISLIDSFSLDEIAGKCGIEGEVIERLATLYGERRPAAILLGYGINKWVHSPDMIRLIDALGALTGNIGISGGGVNHGFETRRHFEPSLLNPRPSGQYREIAEPLLGRGILESADPPVRMIWINGTNPVASCPDSRTVIKALDGLDFMVVVDHFMTDTAELADIFLPATTFLEEEDIVVSWGHNWIGPVNKVIEGPGETRSDFMIAQGLCKRLGLGRETAGTIGEWLTRLFKPMEAAGLTVEEVMRGPVRCPVAPAVAFADRRFKTPSEKFEFVSEAQLDDEKRHPYHLLSILGQSWLNSLILEEEHPAMPKMLIHPGVAEEEGIADGSRVLVRSAAGRLVVQAVLSDKTRRDTLVIPQGSWIKKGGGVNQLTEGLVSTMGKMAAYNSTTVTIGPGDKDAVQERGKTKL